MGLWRFLGGEINHERIKKWNEKAIRNQQQQHEEEIQFQNKLLRMKYKSWKKSNKSLEDKIKIALEIWEEEEFKLFIKKYPKLVPDDLNPFLNKKEAKKEIEKPKDEIEELKKLVEHQAQLIKKLEQQNKQ